MTDITDLHDDLLQGADEIARFMFGNAPGARRRVYHLASGIRQSERLPVFKLGLIICARKSTLLTWIARQDGGSAVLPEAPKMRRLRPAGVAKKGIVP